MKTHKHNYARTVISALIVAIGLLMISGSSYSPVVAETEPAPTPTSILVPAPLYLEKTGRIAYKESPVKIKKPSVPETPEPTPNPWTTEEVIVLAKMVYGEARGIPSKMEQAACVWCVLNRCDEYGESVIEVTTAPYQFIGYLESNPVDNDILELCEDVLSRWYAEKSGEPDVGRVLPSDYLYFNGDGSHNYFRNAFKGGTIWDWSYPNPYET